MGTAVTFDLPVDLNGSFIDGVHFSPFKWSSTCLAVHSRDTLLVGYLQMCELNEESPVFVGLYRLRFKSILQFAWLCGSQMDSLPRTLKFAVCHKSEECEITVFTLICDEKGNTVHKSDVLATSQWIHQICASPHDPDWLVAVLENGSVRLVDTRSNSVSPRNVDEDEGEKKLAVAPGLNNTVPLMNAISSRFLWWHPSKPHMLIIVERSGTVHLCRMAQKPLAEPHSSPMLSRETSCVFSGVCGPFIHGVQVVRQSPERPNAHILVTSPLGVFRCDADRPDCTIEKVMLQESREEEIRQLALHPSPSCGLAAATVGRHKCLKLLKWNSGESICEVRNWTQCQSLSWHMVQPWLVVSSGNLVKLIVIQ